MTTYLCDIGYDKQGATCLVVLQISSLALKVDKTAMETMLVTSHWLQDSSGMVFKRARWTRIYQVHLRRDPCMVEYIWEDLREARKLFLHLSICSGNAAWASPTYIPSLGSPSVSGIFCIPILVVLRVLAYVYFKENTPLSSTCCVSSPSSKVELWIAYSEVDKGGGTIIVGVRILWWWLLSRACLLWILQISTVASRPEVVGLKLARIMSWRCQKVLSLLVRSTPLKKGVGGRRLNMLRGFEQGYFFEGRRGTSIWYSCIWGFFILGRWSFFPFVDLLEL